MCRVASYSRRAKRISSSLVTTARRALRNLPSRLCRVSVTSSIPARSVSPAMVTGGRPSLSMRRRGMHPRESPSTAFLMTSSGRRIEFLRPHCRNGWPCGWRRDVSVKQFRRRNGLRDGRAGHRIKKFWDKLQVMPARPFPGKSRYRSQEFDGGAIDSSDEGYLVAYIDGGARGNPGPAGYGVVIEDEIGRPVAELSEFLGRQTNNYAEYSGLLAALNYTLRHGFKALKVVSDSELMVKQISGEYKVSNATLKELHARAMKMIDQLDYFEIKHVLRSEEHTSELQS